MHKDNDTGVILDAHMIGAKATELIAEATLAIKLESTVAEIAYTIHAHPTLSEIFRGSPRQSGRGNP